MASFNRVFLLGNVTRNIELRYTSAGSPFTEIGLAINRTWKDEHGDKQQEVTFVDCTLWSRQAEIANQYLKKGSAVFVEGRHQLDTWEANGVKRSKLRVAVENLQLLPSRREGTESPRPAAVRPEPSQPVSNAPSVNAPSFEPDLDIDS
jgi:single-strand DNA-binding protein